MAKEKNIYVIAITGASGMIYAHRLLQLLKKEKSEIHLVITKTAVQIIGHELKPKQAEFVLKDAGFIRHDPEKYSSVIASGSHKTSGMVVVPASMGTVGRIASGTSDNLVVRAADVHLKEKRKLIIVPRETPLNAIHLENMLKLDRAGAIILPAMPSFYSGMHTVEGLVDTVVARVLDHLGIGHDLDVKYKPGK
jgi:4-hydroxy-3-polyprenylbenzoate decarboxylase